MFVLVILLCGIALALWWLRPRPRTPPLYPGALPLIGHAHQLLGDSKCLWNYITKVEMYSVNQGGICKLLLGPHTIYILTDPEDSLTLASSCYDKPYIYDFSKAFLNNGLITAEASIWKNHRKVLNSAFNQQVLNRYVDKMNEQAHHLASKLALEVGKDPFNLRKYLVDFTLSTVAQTSMGLDPQEKTWISADYSETLEDLLAIYSERLRKVWLHLSFVFDWSPLKLKHDQLTNKLKNITIQIINKRKSALEAKKNTMSNDSSDQFKSVLDQLVLLPEKQSNFTLNIIRDHLDTLLATAYDTTSMTINIILLVIGSNEDVQDRVFNELQEVFENENFDVRKQDLPKLVYLEAVIRETLRLYPIIPLVGRKVDKDIRLKNYTLRAGSSCVLGLYGLLRHPMWGPDVEQFRPERWLETTNLTKHPSCNAFFGIGKRNCIGRVYSMMVMKTALAHILRRYRVTSDIYNVVWEFEVVLKPVEGHHISLTLRS